MLRLLACGLFAVLTSLAAPFAAAQEAVLKSEELVRLQAIPVSRPMSFELQHTEEQLDYLAWILMRSIDTVNSWNPQHRAWNLYYTNVRHGLEQDLRKRWQTSAPAIRSLSQNPQTALAKYYSETFTVAELDEALEFFRSASGKKYNLYLSELSRVHYRGLLELLRISMDPALGSGPDDGAARRQAWMQAQGIVLEPLPPAYEFHRASAHSAFGGAKPADATFALIAGAPPGSEFLRRLDQMLGDDDRAAVRRFFASSFGEKEKRARKSWSDAVAQSRDLPVVVTDNLRGILDIALRWKKLRASPTALPRSIARIEPETIEIAEHYNTIDIDDAAAPDFVRTCLPGISEAAISRLKDPLSGRSARQVTQTLSRAGAANIFTARQGIGACIPTTAPGYPIPALSSFTATVRVLGMEEGEAKQWYRAIAQEIAADGSSRSLIILPNGNAYEVAFAVSVQRSAALIYSMRLLRARTYQVERYRTVHQPSNVKSISISGSGTAGTEKSLVTTPAETRRELGLPPVQEKAPVRQQHT